MDEDAPEKLKKEYAMIVKRLIDECNDLDLLDFIMQLLQKSK